VGYVVTDADLYDPNAVSRRDMDAWVAANWTPVHEIDLERFSASIFAITRDEIPDLPPPTVPAPEGGSGEIPGLPSVGRPMEDILTGDPDEPSGAPSQPPLGEDGKPIPGPVEPTPGHTVEPPTP
jgi:hypothetical protein